MQVAPPPSLANPLSTGTVRYIPLDFKTPRYQQFNLGLERELTSTTAVSVFYVGTRGTDLPAQTQSANNVRALDLRRLLLVRLAPALGASFGGGLVVPRLLHLRPRPNDSPGPFPAPNASAVPTIQDDLGVDKGNADYDLRHRFTFAATYALPFVKDNRILGGWMVNGIVTVQSGNDFTIYADSTRADLVSGQDPNSGPKTSDQWFNTAVFATPSSQDTDRTQHRRGPWPQDRRPVAVQDVQAQGPLRPRAAHRDLQPAQHTAVRQPEPVRRRRQLRSITQTRLNSERQFQFAARFTF